MSIKSFLFHTSKESARIIPASETTEEEEEERKGKAFLIFVKGWRIQAAAFIKEQSSQRGHKLSSAIPLLFISPALCPPTHSSQFSHSELHCCDNGQILSTAAFTTSARSVEYFIPKDINCIGS